MAMELLGRELWMNYKPLRAHRPAFLWGKEEGVCVRLLTPNIFLDIKTMTLTAATMSKLDWENGDIQSNQKGMKSRPISKKGISCLLISSKLIATTDDTLWCLGIQR